MPCIDCLVSCTFELGYKPALSQIVEAYLPCRLEIVCSEVLKMVDKIIIYIIKEGVIYFYDILGALFNF